MVLLWFSYDLYKDLNANFVIGETEIRKLIVIAVGIATAMVFCLPDVSGDDPPREASE